ncbi:MAG: hypothetical protein VX627_02095 [Candidatus Thermoplasmatota archaeon]|mgnify:FL=1|nr:hypothetical protein [Candidatus Thermoplasmatota archaeon]
MARPRRVTLEVSVTPTQAIRAFRQIADASGWDWNREEGSRMVDRWMVIVPLTRTTRTFRIIINNGEGAGLSLTAWQEIGGSAGGVTKVEWIIPGHLTGKPLQELLQAWSAKHPRCPWRWTFWERSIIGYLLPVWRRSRKDFNKFGFDTSRHGWPLEFNFEPSKWPDTREEE